MTPDGTDRQLDRPIVTERAAEPSVALRRAWLHAFDAGIARHRDAFCDLVHDELGRPTWQTLVADLLPLRSAIAWHRRRLRRLLAPRRLRGGAFWQLGQKIVLERHPVGTVGIIATWNYPVQLLGIQIVQAMAAGNDVVVKPSENAPRTQALLVRIAQDALERVGLDRGRVRSVEATREAGARMLRDEPLDHVVFTGSTAVGREIARACADRLIPSTLELSGCDGAIVFADADPRLAAGSLWNAIVLNAGQTCMAPRRVIVERGIEAAFTQELQRLAGAARPVALVSEEAMRRCAALVDDAIARGGHLLGGVPHDRSGRSMQPAVVAACPRDAPLLEGDHFGPAFGVIVANDADEALAIHRSYPQHLACAVYSRHVRRARRLAPRLRAGIVTINDALVPSAHPAVPLAGHGPSGWGTSRGAEGLLALTRTVSVSNTARFAVAPAGDPPPSILRLLARTAGSDGDQRRPEIPTPPRASGDDSTDSSATTSGAAPTSSRNADS